MKRFIKESLRKSLLEHDSILSSDDLKNIENQVSKEIEKQQKEISDLKTIINNIKVAIDNENKNPKPNTHDSTISFFNELLKQKEEELKRIHPYSKENLIQYYTKHAIKQANYNKERNNYKQQREKEGINKQDIIDLFVTALEGGSNYWYNINIMPNGVKQIQNEKKLATSEAIGEFILNGGSIQFSDIENNKEILGNVDMDSLLDGIQLVKNNHPEVYENILMEEYDANDADIFLQLCVMGEVTFG